MSQRFEGECLHDLRKGDIFRDFTIMFAKGAFVQHVYAGGPGTRSNATS